MKLLKNPIVIAIIILIFILGILVYLYIAPETSINSNSSKTASVEFSTAKATIQTIENSLSSSGQISSALDEKLYLHASYYFEKLLVDTNVLIKEGENILKYTNGTYLTAPYDCVMTSNNLPNTSAVCTTNNYVQIQSIDSLQMSLSVSESDINKIEIGDTVDITLTASKEKIEGHITQISEVGTYSSSGSYFAAVVTFENNGNLKIGMSATCEIIIERKQNVVTVPNEAIQTSDSGDYVIVVNNMGETENVYIEKGISNDAYTEIISGITENTIVRLSESSSSSNSNSFSKNGSYNIFNNSNGEGFSRENMPFVGGPEGAFGGGR